MPGPGKEEAMPQRRSRWKKVIPTATLTAVSFTVSAPHAFALLPGYWPGTPQTPTVVVPPPPVVVPPVVVPPLPPPVFVPPPPPPPILVPPTVPPPVIVPTVPPPPMHNCDSPEPSTLVVAVAGLAAAAGWVARSRKKHEGKAE
jgi:hypothetical protein